MEISQAIRENLLMNSIDLPTLMTTIFVLVDDWYQQNMTPFYCPKPGANKEFKDSEVLSLALMMDYLPFPGETQFLAFMRGNYLAWFPHLLDQSQFNRRLRKLDGVLEQLRRSWVSQLGGMGETLFLIDTKPIPVIGLKRDKRYSHFSGNAAPGWCAARKMNDFGYKLVVLATSGGIPIAYDLVPANTDERLAVEGVFHEIQNTGRNPERLLNKTVEGLCAHIAAKMASHTLRLLLRRCFGIDVLRFAFA